MDLWYHCEAQNKYQYAIPRCSLMSEKNRYGEGNGVNGILELFKRAGPLLHIASYSWEVTTWCNGTYWSAGHQETADVQLYLSVLPHTACAFESYSEANGARGFTLVTITGRSQADIGRVKCQKHVVNVKGQQYSGNRHPILVS